MKHKLLASAAALFALMLPSTAFAARAIRGAVGQVTPTDGAALGSVGFRIWSALPGGTTTAINNYTASCRNVRCIRAFITNTSLNPGGYIGNQESTGPYNGDTQEQPFYELVDASMLDAAGNHIGYFGVAGVTTNNVGVGNALLPGCGTTPPSGCFGRLDATVTAAPWSPTFFIPPDNCFGRLDASVAAPPLSGAYVGYGGAPGTIRAIGGLNPIPNVRIDSMTVSTADLSWNDPPTYESTMRCSTVSPAPASPVLGVRLWKNQRIGDCNSPAGDDPGWVSSGTFNLGQTSTQVSLDPAADCTWFALTVRFTGPAGFPNEVETFRVGVNSQPAMPHCNDGALCASDFNTCTDDLCAGQTCQHFANSASCTDGNACTLNDFCSAGTCVPGLLNPCSDGNPCTSDACVPATGACTHSNVSGSCDDTNPCTINDVCGGGACGGTPISIPPEVTRDRFAANKTTLAWDAVPGAVPGTVYDIVRGRTNELPVGTGPNEVCRASGLTVLSSSETEIPAHGVGLYYLVRARNTCGHGSYGGRSNGLPRVTNACP